MNNVIQPVETIVDAAGNPCIICKKEKYGEVVYMVRYLDSKRWWLNQKDGYPYFKTLAACRNKVKNNVCL